MAATGATGPFENSGPRQVVVGACARMYGFTTRGGGGALPSIQPLTHGYYAPVLRMTAAADRAGSPCGPAGRLALDRLPASATPAIRSSVAEHRRHPPDGITCAFPAASDGQGIQTPRATAADPAHVAVISTRCGSKQAPLRSIAQATLSRRSATERRARACPWPRARSDRYLSWLTGSRWAATRAQW